MKKLYFAYGANLNLNDMAYRCPGAKPVTAFSLKNWRLSFNGVATILPATENDSVPGAIWEITDHCEDSLDIFEGYPYLYTKIHLQQDDVSFMVYVMNENNPAPPSKNYLKTIQQGYHHWGLSVPALFKSAGQS